MSHFSNKNDDMVLFRFQGCDGLGLQQADSLTRITGDVFQDRFPRAARFLLDESGKILCTLLPDQAAYEHADNRDRRRLNTANGFNVTWSDGGRSCTVCRSASQSPSLLGKLATLFAGGNDAAFAASGKRHTIKILNNGQPAPDGLLKVWFDDDSFIEVTGGEIQVSDADADRPMRWAVRLVTDGAKWIDAKGEIYPRKYIRKHKPMELSTATWSYRVKPGNVKSRNLDVNVANKVILRYLFEGNKLYRIKFNTPKENYYKSDIIFSCDNARVIENGGNLDFEPLPDKRK